MKKKLLLFFVLQFFFSIISFSQPIPVLQPYLSGFTRPVKVTHAYDSRLFIAEIGGKIKVVKNGIVDHNNPFLNISSKMNDLDWAGIFSIVFDPNYQTNGYFYVMYVVKSKFEINISRFTRVGGANSDLADASSETLILTIPYTDILGGHRGGDMAFGKDNFLYISTGDNGPGSRGVMGDPELNSQNSNLLFGKIIRLDVNSSSPADNILQKIWAKGLRNPWRISFDRENGDFWYGDNGQDGWEEVNYLKATDITTPRNFGWDYMEGNAVYRNCNCTISTSFIAPKFVYPGFTNNGGNSASVMGGYVYRGTKYASLKGSYIFGDYQTFKIGMITPAGFSGFLTNVSYPSLVSFGEDNQGELYAISFYDGTIAQITGPTTPLPVKLENFTAKGNGCSIDLQWSTSFESNFSHFEVERSADGKSFYKIKSIP
ncbi:MAG: PQQ-dependent sugar dehydrogenase, partial [Dyadobacter sp.]